MKTSIKTIGLLAALAVGLTSPLFSQVPDLTASGAIAALKTDPASSPVYGDTYNLGATGMRGWICNKMDSNHERAQGRTTLNSRQILVTHVGAASPADGVVKVDDVILGVDGKPFSDDARKSIALAIQEAETEARDGVLKLTVSRSGTVQELSIKLAVMGTYSATAPWDCPKSKRIFEAACKVLEKEELTADWAGPIKGLALLATGNPEYLPKLQDFARILAALPVDPDKKPSGPAWGNTWPMAYQNLFLCEYYMVILAAVENPSPADTMFSTGIRMAGLTALTKYHFEEGIAAAVGLAKTQGGHGSESRTGEIMKMITAYGSAAKPQIPALRELIASLNAEVENREFPGDLNKLRVGAVEEAIRSIETATTQPEMRSVKR